MVFLRCCRVKADVSQPHKPRHENTLPSLLPLVEEGLIDTVVCQLMSGKEPAWQSAEVDALYRLAAAGVRVPTPYQFIDGVLLMDLVADADGDAAAGNNHAQRMLLRDVTKLKDFSRQFAPELLSTDFGPEVWSLYERGLLTQDSVLTGHFKPPHKPVNLGDVMRDIDEAKDEEVAKRLRMQGGE